MSDCIAFLVVCGQYSDYSVNCVCLSREVAEEIARRLGTHEYSVQEVELAYSADEHVHLSTMPPDLEAT